MNKIDIANINWSKSKWSSLPHPEIEVRAAARAHRGITHQDRGPGAHEQELIGGIRTYAGRGQEAQRKCSKIECVIEGADWRSYFQLQWIK